MSRILASSSVSVLNGNVSMRCGWIFHFRKIRTKNADEMPSPPVRNRADQCVIPAAQVAARH
jgi:hypothetical protein